MNGASGGTDTLIGPNEPSTFSVTGVDSGTLSVTGTGFTAQPVTFTGIQYLQGGSAQDEFSVADTGSLAGGTIKGGGSGDDSVSIQMGPAVGPITVTDTGGSNTLNVVSTSGDSLTKTANQVTSSLYPNSTITDSGFATVTTQVPSGFYADILRLLNNVPSTSQTLPSEDLDGVLDLSAVTLSFTNVTSSGGVGTGGTVGISSGPATLFPGTDHSASIASISGTYNLGTETFTLTLTAVDLDAGGLLTSSISSITFQDAETNSSPTKVLATVASATVTLPPLDNTQLTLAGSADSPALTITRGGFSIANLTVNNLPSLTWQGVLEVVSPVFQLTNVNYTKASDSLTGTIGISAGSVVLFPGQSGWTSTVAGFSGSYTFGTTSGAVQLGATSVDVDLGGAAELDASNVSFNLEPSQGIFSLTTGFSTLLVNGAGGQAVVDLSGDFALSSGMEFGASFAGTGLRALRKR